MWKNADSEKQIILVFWGGYQMWASFPGIRKNASYCKKCVFANMNENQKAIHWSVSANTALHSPVSLMEMLFSEQPKGKGIVIWQIGKV